MSSLCRDCGEPITWAKTPTGSTHPPLVYAGLAVIIAGGITHEVGTYQRHHCTEENIERWQLEVDEKTRQFAQYNLERDLAWEQALKHKCPKCEVKAKHYCLNLKELRKGNQQATSWPHPERYQREREPNDQNT